MQATVEFCKQNIESWRSMFACKLDVERSETACRLRESARQRNYRYFKLSAPSLVSQAPPPACAGAPSRREPKVTLRQTNGTPRVSLRLGRAHVPATRCVAFHYARVATLRRPLQSRKITPHNVCRGDHNVFEENLRLAKRSSARNTMISLQTLSGGYTASSPKGRAFTLDYVKRWERKTLPYRR